MPTMLVCSICKKEFEKPSRGAPKKYCSAVCNGRAQRAKHKKPMNEFQCAQCGAPGSNTNQRARFCSDACRYTYTNARRLGVLGTCTHCGTSFRGEKGTRFCSVSCSVSGTKIEKTLACVDCGTSFEFVGRTRAHRCVPCRTKFASTYQMRWRATKDPSIKLGAGSGGAQWREDNHRWNEYSRYHDQIRKQGYAQGFNRVCYEHWDKACASCGVTDAVSIIDVHHINGVRDDSRPCNLVPLCRSCHMRKAHARKHKSESEYVEATMAILPKECRSKIAELSGKAETLIRTEGCDEKRSQGQSIGAEETITPPRGRDTLLAG